MADSPLLSPTRSPSPPLIEPLEIDTTTQGSRSTRSTLNSYGSLRYNARTGVMDSHIIENQNGRVSGEEEDEGEEEDMPLLQRKINQKQQGISL